MNTINEASFNKILVSIRGDSDKLAQMIHEAGLFALSQAFLHSNNGAADRLVTAMGKKHDAQRVVNWLCFYGKLTVKNGVVVYRNRKDIVAETFEAFMEKAENDPYWTHTAQKALVFRVDYISMLKSMIAKHKTALEKSAAGEEVIEDNVAVIAEVEALLARMTTKPGVIDTTVAAA